MISLLLYLDSSLMFSRVLFFLDFFCSHFRGGDGQSLPAGPQVSSRRHGAAVPRAWGQDAQDRQEMRSLSRVPHWLWHTLAYIHTYCLARPSPSRVKDRQSGSNALLSATRAFAILNHVYSRVSYSRHLLHVSVFRGWLTISWQQPLKPPWQKEWIIFQTGAFLQSSEQIHTWSFDKKHILFTTLESDITFQREIFYIFEISCFISTRQRVSCAPQVILSSMIKECEIKVENRGMADAQGWEQTSLHIYTLISVAAIWKTVFSRAQKAVTAEFDDGVLVVVKKLEGGKKKSSHCEETGHWAALGPGPYCGFYSLWDEENI